MYPGRAVALATLASKDCLLLAQGFGCVFCGEVSLATASQALHLFPRGQRLYLEVEHRRVGVATAHIFMGKPLVRLHNLFWRTICVRSSPDLVKLATTAAVAKHLRYRRNQATATAACALAETDTPTTRTRSRTASIYKP